MSLAATEVLLQEVGSQEADHPSKEVVAEVGVPATKPTAEMSQDPELVTTTKTGTTIDPQRDTPQG